MISGTASGSSTFHSNWRFDIPIPRPASRTEPGTLASPTTVLR